MNRIGAIISVLHPLMPAKGLVEALKKTNTKVLIYFDRFYFNSRAELMDNKIKVILASATDYLQGIQLFGMKIYNRRNNKLIKELPECDNAIEFYTNIMSQKHMSAGDVDIKGDDVCLYLQSGGTTGVPKTIEITNYALNSIAAKLVKLTDGYIPGVDSMLMVLPIFHGFGIAVCMHAILACCTRVVMVPAFNPKKINKIIKREKVTHIAGVPAMYDKLTKCKNFRGKYLKNIMNAYCGGDVLTDEIKARYDSIVESCGGKSRLYQGYGLAEAIAVCSSNTSRGEKAGSIGLPMEGIKFKVIDDKGKQLTVGNKGELCIAGDILMKGYYGESQSECISVDSEGTRWLSTGDYGYIDKDGYIFFSGRKKRIVIISGINVFPFEIEKEVNTLEEISCSCAVASQKEGKKIIKLYVELNEGYVLDQVLKNKIITTLKSKMMKYSIPGEIIEQKLPRTPLAKIDYRKLEENG
ncbi:MAG: long-chain fatty acid--CoA ligase [Clostridia bacterium]|nr:long-chain fatty acid--CoA ligase [Clostridia bacterium]